ncbi:DoxX family protein [Entomobacter blattae]|uniref:Inner membrane protein YphA n=1 Tax=Entomobacter blattae TaxID=2762277 RepID=A0A7H1NPK2_9PROT|nr:DoxX family protein [Entomobacter blattae]QNT77712.1 Inner membrane protein YphA [Entomobacter blattae]
MGDSDVLKALARLMLGWLYVYFGYIKLAVFGIAGTTGYMESLHLPMPAIAAVAAIVIELGLGTVFVLGLCTRWLALLFTLYSVVTAVTGHQYWTMTEMMPHLDAMEHFWKNVAIAGGFLMFFIYPRCSISLDRLLFKNN